MNLAIIWGEKWGPTPTPGDVARQAGDDDVIFLSEDPVLRNHFPDLLYMPSESGCLSQALSNTYHLWPEFTYMMVSGLSRDICQRIRRSREPIAFWKLGDDIVAISVYHTEATALMLSLYQAGKDWEERKGSGDLWETYRIYCGPDDCSCILKEV